MPGTVCRYCAPDRTATLTVIMREASHRTTAERLFNRREQMPELCHRAAPPPQPAEVGSRLDDQ